MRKDLMFLYGLMALILVGCEYLHIRDAWLFEPHDRWITDRELPARRYILTTWRGTSDSKVVYAHDKPVTVVCLRDFSGPTEANETISENHRGDRDIVFLTDDGGTLEPFEVPVGKQLEVEGLMMTRKEELAVRTHVGGGNGGTTCALDAPVSRESREPLKPPLLPAIICRRIYEAQPNGCQRLIWKVKDGFVID